MQKRVIYVSSYPKSGSTWLTRLLADILDSTAGGCMPSEDANEIATEGLDRPGPYIVRKGHYVLVDDESGDVVPRPHRMAYKQLTDEKIVFLVRDPRDICISGAYHWRVTPAVFLNRMIEGGVAGCGRWDRYVDGWLDYLNTWLSYDYLDIHMVKYEQLLMSSFYELDTIFKRLDIDMPPRDQLEVSLQRQSFANRSKDLDEKEMRRNNMRKGIVGDWRDHFTREMQDKVWNEFGWIMETLGYEY